MEGIEQGQQVPESGRDRVVVPLTVASDEDKKVLSAVGAMSPATHFGGASETGHHLSYHDDNCVIDAWGNDVTTCLLEALGALVDSFAIVEDVPVSILRPLGTSAIGVEDALVALLEEVIFVLDVDAEVPVHFHLVPAIDGGFVGDMEVVSSQRARIIGLRPTAVSYHELSMSHTESGWRCHVLVER